MLQTKLVHTNAIKPPKANVSIPVPNDEIQRNEI